MAIEDMVYIYRLTRARGSHKCDSCLETIKKGAYYVRCVMCGKLTMLNVLFRKYCLKCCRVPAERMLEQNANVVVGITFESLKERARELTDEEREVLKLALE